MTFVMASLELATGTGFLPFPQLVYEGHTDILLHAYEPVIDVRHERELHIHPMVHVSPETGQACKVSVIPAHDLQVPLVFHLQKLPCDCHQTCCSSITSPMPVAT